MGPLCRPGTGSSSVLGAFQDDGRELARASEAHRARIAGDEAPGLPTRQREERREFAQAGLADPVSQALSLPEDACDFAPDFRFARAGEHEHVRRSIPERPRELDPGSRRERTHVPGRGEVQDGAGAVTGAEAFEEFSPALELDRRERRIRAPGIGSCARDVAREVLHAIQRVGTFESDGGGGIVEGPGGERLAPVPAREARSPGGARQQAHGRALEVPLRVDREVGPERAQFGAEVGPGAPSCPAPEEEQPREARDAPEQIGELGLHGPGDPGPGEGRPQGVEHAQGGHDVAQVGEPDEQDARWVAHGPEGRAGYPRALPRVNMIRRISTKLVLAVLAAVVLPFVAFAFYINDQMGHRLTRDVVQQALLGLAKNLAGELDTFVGERRQDLELWAETPFTRSAIREHVAEQDQLSERIPGAREVQPWDAAVLARWAREGAFEGYDRDFWLDRTQLTRELDRYIELRRMYDVMLLVSDEGRLVTCCTRGPSGERFDEDYLALLFAEDYSGETWFQAAMRGENHAVDQHLSPLAPPGVVDSAPVSERYELGFAAPVHDDREPDRLRGVLYALVNWSYVQEIVSTPKVRSFFRGLVREEPSPYAWIWAADADTILGHPKPQLYHQSVTRDVKLPQLTQAVLENPDGEGLYPEYRFEGKEKNAAFKRCLPEEEGGFGWVVGVGIDNDDIYATAEELQRLLLGGTAAVLFMAILWTLYIARRTTGPIQALQQYTRRVAEGDLDARIEVRSGDELGALADDFNRMTRELKEGRERLVKAEKDAAWREMAQQIAHDIKNPLTPVSLSLDLLERARHEKAEGWEEILDRTMELVRRQVANLRQIAHDFSEFTGGTRPHPEEVEVRGLLAEVLHLHDAWAVKQGVDMHVDGVEATVFVDRGKLRRVFVNLVTNALQAMPEGGELFADVVVEGAEVRVGIRDTGEGVSGDARRHLFEPYFTTKSEGTGLGLAISKQMVEQMGGRIELESSESGRGTRAIVGLPLAASSIDRSRAGSA